MFFSHKIPLYSIFNCLSVHRPQATKFGLLNAARNYYTNSLRWLILRSSCSNIPHLVCNARLPLDVFHLDSGELAVSLEFLFQLAVNEQLVETLCIARIGHIIQLNFNRGAATTTRRLGDI